MERVILLAASKRREGVRIIVMVLCFMGRMVVVVVKTAPGWENGMMDADLKYSLPNEHEILTHLRLSCTEDYIVSLLFIFGPLKRFQALPAPLCY